MIKSKSDFPHPVLSMDGDDYIKECTFNCYLGDDVVEDDQHIEFTIGYQLECDFLQQLIEEGRALVMAYIESPNASFRKICKFPIDENEVRIEVYKGEIAKKLTIKPQIIACEAIENYQSQCFNQEYFENAIFSVRKGDILAQERQYEIIVEDINEFKNCASVFSIRLDEEMTDGMKVNYNDEKINIQLNRREHDRYRQLRERQEFRIFLSAMLVFPALVEAIEAMKRELLIGEEGISDKRWYLVLEKQLNKKIDIIKVNTFEEVQSISRELMLLKVKYNKGNRKDIMENP